MSLNATQPPLTVQLVDLYVELVTPHLTVDELAVLRRTAVKVRSRLIEKCPSCGGEGGRRRWTRGSRMPDPQTEEVCDMCEGSGLLPEDERRPF